ncbi:Adenosine 3'-phospho 5'-phosphosulfate transporter 2 [Tritrichomonas foetus]|uniref:Adenosine 3'-phospho 5'-phosphosulfate transporter 2 n=1 Tax=Tritrichomonas foetus TaxID=1144522 RepID=A0A1J4JQ43_9EUKA|nr:Adenosine 3'-phospho 5'-phosphosulfate transporter 2 [Tritrichomonas foetus]|eukprot:OHT01233.1 Adenosine 3'-phospho 5'-phosphosulfate transporter 2 [Tritrichomonas foetus]
MQAKENEAHIFCISVASWPKWAILLLASFGIFGSFLLSSISHEYLIKHYHFSEAFFLTFVQFLGYSLLSLPTFFKIITGKEKIKAPLIAYFFTSLCLTFSMGLTNFASIRLSYATGVLFKSSKLIPVMIFNIIFLKKKPKISEAISVIFIVLGLIGVSLGDFKGKNKFDVPGIIAISMSLVAGALASNMEEKIMVHYGASQDETISMLYSVGALILLMLSIFTSQLPKSIQRIMENPSSLIYLSFFGILGSFGIQFVYLSMKVFGSLITVMITSCRKALTITLSFVIFKDKKFTAWHAVSIMLITLGISLNIYDKNVGRKKKEEKLNDQETLLENEEAIEDENVSEESAVNFEVVPSSSCPELSRV